MTRNRPIGIGIIGLGHWGPNHLRVFHEAEHTKVVICADSSESRRNTVQKRYRDVAFTAKAEDIFSCPEIDAVIIATPTHTHYALAKQALMAGKHLLLEKPMCALLEEAKELSALAEKNGKVLMNGHVFIYNRGIQFIKEGLSHGDFGKLQYLDARRTNLGPIRRDVNVIQDLAAHEFAIFDYFFEAVPLWVQAAGSCVLGTSHEDVAFLSMEYPGGILAHVQVSWLHPQKIRSLTLVGQKRMVFWNDMEPAEPIRIYDKGIMEEPYYDSFGEFQMRLRDADVLIPKVYLEEPLRLEAEAFLNAVRSGHHNRAQTESGIRVMRCLEAANRSLKEEGKRIPLMKGAA